MAGAARTTLALVVVCAAGGMIYGYNVSAEAYLAAVSETFQLGTTSQEAVSGAASLGAMLSMPVSGLISDRLGRRKASIIGCIGSLIGPIMIALSSSGAQLIGWRIVTGVGNGFAIHNTPVYVAETCTPKHRGIIIGLFQLSVSLGLTLGPLLQLGFAQWRLVAAVGATPALVVALILFFRGVPESPVWRSRQRQTSACCCCASRARGARSTTTPSFTPVVQATGGEEAEEGQPEQQQHHHHHATIDGITVVPDPSSTWSEGSTLLADAIPSSTASPAASAGRRQHCCCRPRHSHAELQSRTGLLLVIGTILALTNNSVDIVMFYGPQILQSAGLGSASALGTVAALSAVSAATVLPAMWLVGRCNRRVLFLAATTTVVATFFVEALAFSGGFTRDVRLGLAIAAFVVFLIAFQAGPGTMFLLMLSELHSASTRGVAVAVNTFCMSLFSVIINGTALSLVKVASVAGTFALYGVVFLLCLAMLWWYLPDLTGTNLGHDPPTSRATTTTTTTATATAVPAIVAKG